MAARLKLLQSKAAEAKKLAFKASESVSKQGTTYYRQLLEQNKQYIQEPPTVEKCNELSKQLFYTRLARPKTMARYPPYSRPTEWGKGLDVDSNRLHHVLARFYFIAGQSLPGRYEAFWKEVDTVKHLWRNRQELKVEDAGIAALFGLECFAWYCAGEIVGRGFTITGYSI